MVDTEARMDAEIFARYSKELPKNNGFAQCADALVSQVKATLASGPVCKIVIPEDNTLTRVLYPLLSIEQCSMTLARQKLLQKDGPAIPYYLVTLQRSVRRK